jgi:hypothetical protein
MAAMNDAMNSHRLDDVKVSLNAVKVRMSDSAVLAGAVSLLYALALIIFPLAFPQLLERIFERGHFFPALTVLLLVTNEVLLVLISRRRSQKLGLFTPGYIAFLTIAVVLVFRVLVYIADAQAQLSYLFHRVSGARDGISAEELLVYTHVAIVSGIFLPYLLVRVTQNYGSEAKSADKAAKARNAVAAQ